MGTTTSKVEILQEETALLQRDLAALRKERDASREKTKQLEKELRVQRKTIRRLDAFAKDTAVLAHRLDGDIDRVWTKTFAD